MNDEEVLAAFDEQIRRHAGPPGQGEDVEREDHVVRIISDGWGGVTWSDLDPSTADAVIAAQVDRFAQLARPWEWKHYSYDQPVDLPERLVAAGLSAEPAETLLVAEITDLDVAVPPPVGVQLRPVVDERGVEAFVRLHADVFGGDHSAIGETLLASLSQELPSHRAVIAWSEGAAVGAGRVELQLGTDFASIWGGGTLPEWRGRGVFRSVVAYRAALASARGFRYLQVDASPDSRPILRRLGFVELATTTPFAHPGV
jgi:GNAT superfamily N-acetyltransferase